LKNADQFAEWDMRLSPWMLSLVAVPLMAVTSLGRQQRLANAGCYRGALDGQANAGLRAAIKACPVQALILRVETGMHVAQIIDMAADSSCHVLATGSFDKTVRLWSMPDGRLIRTQRVPIADDPEGFIYAVAVSPDGSLAAAGGVDAHRAVDGNGSVYIFDVATGRSVHRFPANGVVTGLAFSSDGHRLAVAQGTNGLNLFRRRQRTSLGDGQCVWQGRNAGRLWSRWSDFRC
jgi:WD domain, G-beta repeat